MGNVGNLLQGASGDNNIITLYHGTSVILENPTYGIGKSDNDYGSGFYLTEDYNQAAEWACGFGSESSYVNEYKLDVSDLSVLNMDKLGPLAWIAEVASHRIVPHDWWADLYEEFVRTYKPDTNYDVLRGLRADDSYLSIITDFFDGTFGAMEVASLFKEGDLGSQVFIRSEKAFGSIMFVKRTQVYGVYSDRISTARRHVVEVTNRRRADLLRNKAVVPYPSFADALDRKLTYNNGGFYD